MINLEKFFLAVVFTGFVTAHTGFWGEINTSAIASTYNTTPPNQILYNSVATLGESMGKAKIIASKQIPAPNLPLSVSRAIQTNLQQRTAIEQNNLIITSFTPRTWSDACLGLASSNQFCAQVMTPGWRVIISSNNESQNTWIYRTNRDGSVLRLEQ